MSTARDRSQARPENLPNVSPGLHFSEGSFRAVANSSYDWESWHDPEGRLVWVNPAVERVTGYSPEECLAMCDYPLAMAAPEEHARIADMLEDARAGNSCNDMEFRSLHRNGESRWMAVSWQPMHNDDGEHLGFRTSIRDITDRRTMRDQIRSHAQHLEQLVQQRTARIQQLEWHRRQMEKAAALGQLAAGVAHEVNNPLAGIRNAFALIKSDLTPEHQHFELLELIDREIDRISSIIHQMYQLYRRSPQAAHEFVVERTVSEVTYLLEGVARKNQVSLQIESIAPKLTVTLPEGEVKQILYNVIRNAIQASPPGGNILVRIERGGQEVRVITEDEGEGINDEDLPHIFDPFFSTKNGEPKTGMGLGLSVSRSLIEAMGGQITVDTTPGQGSRFTAVFPLRVGSEIESQA